MISFIDVSFSYRDKSILEKASFTIPERSIVSLLGDSGTGKSTVAKILTGILKPSHGRVEIDGRLLVSDSQPYDRKLGLGIQMVHQHPYLSLDPRQRIGKGFLEIVRYHHMADREHEETFIRDAVAAMGLEPETLNHLPSQISGGEAQRVSMAKALLFSPRLLILDEATSMLDVSTQANVLGLAKRVQISRGGSILLITHDHEVSEGYSDITYMIGNKIIRRIK